MPMAEAWPPSVGARVRPVETAQVAFSPEGDPVPLAGEGPTWARLRYALPSDGNDRREALVADVEEGEAESGGNARASHARASLVWNDGSDEDGVSLAFLGPAPVDDERSDAEALGVVVPRMVESAETDADRSERRAAAASARGAFRFRRGDFAAAAAEYVEACAWLLSAVPREHVRLVLPGDEKDWTLPPPTFSRAERFASPSRESRDDARGTRKREEPFPFPPRVGVGSRVRVSGSDGASRLALVACVDSDDETCDVLFETASDGDDDGEEDAVAFSRLRGASLVGLGGEDERDEKKQKTSRALETLVSVTLADALLNVARCHLRLASENEASETSLGGGDAAAAAADAAASASTSLRASTAAFFLRGKARGARRRFDDAARDLETALRLATNRLAKRRASASTSSTDVDGLASLERDVAAIGAALRDTRAAAKARRRADRRLAAAILGHVRDEGVDLGLDPESDLARHGGARSARGFGRKEKDGSVPLGEVARVVGERVAGKRCVVS